MKKYLGVFLFSFLGISLSAQEGWARFIQPKTILRAQSKAIQIVFDFDKGVWMLEVHNSITPPPRNQGRAGRDLPGGAAMALGMKDVNWCQNPCTDPKFFFNDKDGGWNQIRLFVTENGVKRPIVPFEPEFGAFRFNAVRVDKDGVVFPVVRDRKGGIISTGGYGITEEVEQSRIGSGIGRHRNPDNTVAWTIDLTSEQLAAMMLFEDDFSKKRDDDPPPPPPQIPGTKIRVEGNLLKVPAFMKPQATGSFFFAHTGDGWCTSQPCDAKNQFVNNGTEFEISICAIPLNDKRFNGGVSTQGTGFIDSWMNLFPDRLGTGVKIDGTSYLLDMTDQQITNVCQITPPPPQIPGTKIRVEGNLLKVPAFMKPQATGSFFFAHTGDGWCTSQPCDAKNQFVNNGTEFEISICAIPLNDKRFNGGVSTQGTGFIDSWMNLFPDRLGTGVKIDGTSYLLDMTDQQITELCH